VLVYELLVDRAHDIDVVFDGIQIEQRDTKFMRCGNGYGTRIREFLVDEERNERQLFFLCPLGRLDKLLLGDNAILPCI
jgi:hypothetical protein